MKFKKKHISSENRPIFKHCSRKLFGRLGWHGQWLKCKFGGPGTLCDLRGPYHSVGGPLYTLNLGPCHLVTVQFCNAYDTKTKINNSLKITPGFTPTVSLLIYSA